ncbi:MAG: 2-C-methyl-D-erythritol 4-phosphate cytidylyltransferase [Planctomycetota bacterium]|nr:2-C-methyl-D-erythritol 4-phosphate cytidylyltransferase [Planctomycetota bacterium]
MQDTAVILAAAGSSSRFGNPLINKVYALLGGKPVWQHSADTFASVACIQQTILVVQAEDREMIRQKFSATVAIMGIEIVAGGSQRWESVRNALAKLKPNIQFVAVHDAARPMVAKSDIESVIDAARKYGAAILGEPIFGTVKRTNSDGVIESTVPRERLYQAQTPQVFRRDWLEKAYASAATTSPPPTDDAQLMEALGHPVKLVPGNAMNIKITTQADLRWAEVALKSRLVTR